VKLAEVTEGSDSRPRECILRVGRLAEPAFPHSLADRRTPPAFVPRAKIFPERPRVFFDGSVFAWWHVQDQDHVEIRADQPRLDNRPGNLLAIKNVVCGDPKRVARFRQQLAHDLRSYHARRGLLVGLVHTNWIWSIARCCAAAFSARAAVVMASVSGVNPILKRCENSSRERFPMAMGNPLSDRERRERRGQTTRPKSVR